MLIILIWFLASIKTPVNLTVVKHLNWGEGHVERCLGKLRSAWCPETDQESNSRRDQKDNTFVLLWQTQF